MLSHGDRVLNRFDLQNFQDDEYEPNDAEYIFTGCVAIIIFIGLFIYAASSLYNGVKPYTEFVYWGTIVMCLFETPRFVAMANDGEYSCVSCYICHIVATTCFFAVYTYVCYHWAYLLKVGKVAQVVYSRNALIAANIVFAIIGMYPLLLIW